MTLMIITFDERKGGGAVMAVRTHFDSSEGMERVLAIGIEEGMRILLSQIDSVLAQSCCLGDEFACHEQVANLDTLVGPQTVLLDLLRSSSCLSQTSHFPDQNSGAPSEGPSNRE